MYYYYDDSVLRLFSQTFGEEGASELSLPEVVYDSDGNVMRLVDVHDDGRNDVFMEVKPMTMGSRSS